MSIALVCMPVASPLHPSPAVGVLKAVLVHQGLTCEDFYFSLDYAAFLGLDAFFAINYGYEVFAGEFLFSHLANFLPVDEEGYYRALRRAAGNERIDALEPSIDHLRQSRKQSESFIDACFSAVDWDRFVLVGFSCTFDQVAASIALSRLIKKYHPHLPIVFGGASFHGEMGTAWVRECSVIDFACTGDGEDTILHLVKALSGQMPLDEVPNLAYRHGEDVVATGRAFRDIRKNPVPDYSGYYSRASRFGFDAEGFWKYHRIPFETSRGCWWGSKSHCVFCGLNSSGISFRKKPLSQAMKEIDELSRLHRFRDFEAVDNIMPKGFDSELHDAFACRHLDYTFFYEVKSDLTLQQLWNLYKANVVHLQPGMESLSTRLLRLLGKGVSLLENVFFLKWARYFGMEVSWNLLWGIPGERWEDFREQFAIIAAIPHLQPPTSVPEIRIMRGSPMHRSPQKYNVRGMKPSTAFIAAFPDYVNAAHDLTGLFEADPVGISREEGKEVLKVVEQWRERYADGAFLGYLRMGNNSLLIRDARRVDRVTEQVLEWPSSCLYELAGLAVTTPSKITAALLEITGVDFSVSSVRGMCDALVRDALMLEEEGAYLALAVPVSRALRETTVSNFMKDITCEYRRNLG